MKAAYVVEQMQDHELVGLDAQGALCSCGAKSPSQLEHLGLVALDAVHARSVGSLRRRVVVKVRARVAAQERLEWLRLQVRVQNLESFRRHQIEWEEVA